MVLQQVNPVLLWKLPPSWVAVWRLRVNLWWVMVLKVARITARRDPVEKGFRETSRSQFINTVV
jgi:hypothetical protein